MTTGDVRGRDMIESILHVNRQEKLFTSSRDGTVRVWHASTLNHLKARRRPRLCSHFLSVPLATLMG
jgi:WD40 repeat protein